MTEDVGAQELGGEFMVSGTWLIATHWALEPGKPRWLTVAPLFVRASSSGEIEKSIPSS